MDVLAKAMAPIYYNCIYVYKTWKYEDVPEVYRLALDAYIASKEQAPEV